MSHFTVLVIGQDPEKQLQPFHEFECTGTDDKYVQDLDETEETRADFDKSTDKMIKVPAGVIVPEDTPDLMTHPVHGTLVSRYAKCFQVPNPEYNPDASPFDRKPETIFQLPEGYEEIEVPKSEVESFADYLSGWYGREVVPFGEQPDLEGKHKYGYALLNEAGEVEKVIRRTNPNKKWDWHVLGGRWTGFFKMKPRTSAVRGRPGLMTEAAPEGTADQAFKLDIDFDGMRSEEEAKAAQEFDAIRAIIEPHLPVTSWVELRGKYLGDNPELPGGIDAARKAYRDQPAVKALNASEAYRWKDAEDYAGDRATFIRQRGIQRCMTFAIIKDGQWYERGSMGWWGAVADEKEQDTWIEEFGKLVDGLPDDTLLSVYDCHI